MQNQFEKFIQNLVSNKFSILPDAKIQFNIDAQDETNIFKTLNISFLILLAGSNHPNYNSAKKFINNFKKH